MNKELTNTTPDLRSINFGKIVLDRLTPMQEQEWTFHRGGMHTSAKKPNKGNARQI